MKVLVPFLYSTGYFDPECDKAAGGAETGVYLNGMEWRNLGADVNFICYHPRRKGCQEIDGVRVWFVEGRTIRGNSGTSAAKVYRSIFQIIRAARPDVFYQAGADLTTGLYYAFCRLHGIPTVQRLANDRDLLPELRRMLGPWRHRAYLMGLHGARVRIAQTFRQQAMLRELRGLDSIRIPNCKILAEPKAAGPRGRVTWIARAREAKRPYLFLDLVRAHPGIRFCMVAPGYGDIYEADLKHAASDLPNLEFRGLQSFDEVQTLLAESSLLVSTSEYEGFPNTFLEASLQRTPVLSLEIDPDGYLERCGAGQVFSRMEDLSSALPELLARPDRLAEMGSRGRMEVEAEYDVKQVAPRYLQAFQLAIERARR